jgi:hypothetical protein
LLLAGVAVSAFMIYGVNQTWVWDGLNHESWATGVHLSTMGDNQGLHAGSKVEMGAALVLVGVVIACLYVLRRHPAVLLVAAGLFAAGGLLALSGVGDARTEMGYYSGLTETAWMDRTTHASTILLGLAAAIALTGCALLAVRVRRSHT